MILNVFFLIILELWAFVVTESNAFTCVVVDIQTTESLRCVMASRDVVYVYDTVRMSVE